MIGDRILEHPDLLLLKRPPPAAARRRPPVAARVARSCSRSSAAARPSCAASRASSTAGTRRRSSSRAREIAPRSARSSPSCAATCSSAATAPRRSPARSARRSATSSTRSRPASSPATGSCRSSSVGAYLPAGRVPLLASPFMTVLVPKVAGVETVVAARRRTAARGSSRRSSTARRSPGRPDLRARRRPGARGDGVRARGHDGVDMIVGAGNATSPRPSASSTGASGSTCWPARRGRRDRRRHGRPRAGRRRPARPGRARADLAGRARTTSEALGRACAPRSSASSGLGSRDVAARLARPRQDRRRARPRAAPVSDQLAPEHLEVQPPTTPGTTRAAQLRSIFLGRATVAYSTRHDARTTCSDAGPPLHAASVPFLKRYLQRIDRADDIASGRPISRRVAARHGPRASY